MDRSGGALPAGRAPLRLRALSGAGLRLLAGRARAVPRLARPHAPRLGPHPVRAARAGRSARLQRLLSGRLGPVPAAAAHRAGRAALSRCEKAEPAPARRRRGCGHLLLRLHGAARGNKTRRKLSPRRARPRVPLISPHRLAVLSSAGTSVPDVLVVSPRAPIVYM